MTDRHEHAVDVQPITGAVDAVLEDEPAHFCRIRFAYDDIDLAVPSHRDFRVGE
jgi:hypothetical protein